MKLGKTIGLSAAMLLASTSSAEGQDKAIQGLSDSVSKCVDTHIGFSYSTEEATKICKDRAKNAFKLECLDDLTSQGIGKQEALSKCGIPSNIKLIGPVELCFCSELKDEKEVEPKEPLDIELLVIS